MQLQAAAAADLNYGLTSLTLRSVEELEQETQIWNKLVDEGYGGNPFLSMGWQTTWLRHFGKKCDVEYLKIFSKDGETLAYFPLISKEQSFRRIPSRILGVAANRQTPAACPIVRADAAEVVMHYFAGRILPKMNWDLFVAKELQDDLYGVPELKAALQAHFPHTQVDEGPGNWVLEDAPAFETYFRTRREDIRRNEKKYPKQLEALGSFRFRMVSKDLKEADIADYHRVWSCSWKEPETEPNFHPDLMRIASQDGSLRLGFLYLDARPFAVQFWQVKGRKIYAVKTAYDEEFRRYAPGTLLTVRMLKQLLDDEGMTALDFLKGDEDYKRNWATKRKQQKHVLVFRGSAKGSLAFMIDRKLTPTIMNLAPFKSIKRLRPRLP